MERFFFKRSFLDPPTFQGAIDEEGELTAFGVQISDFPLDPLLATALLRSGEFKATEPVLTIIAMLSVPNPFLRPKWELRIFENFN